MFYQVVNNAKAKVASPYTAGGNSITLDNGSTFGSPTTISPILFSTFAADGTPYGVYKATGRSSNQLTGVTLISGTDHNLLVNDLVEVRWTADHVNQITSILSSLLGSNTKALNTNAHAEGLNTLGSGDQCHAEGQGTVAGGTPYNCTISGANVIVPGFDLTGFGSFYNSGPAVLFDLVGGSGLTTFSTIVISDPTLVGSDTHFTLSDSTLHTSGKIYSADAAVNSHAEGTFTVASSNSAHSEGNYTKANSIAAHTEGSNTLADGPYCHAEGDTTVSSGGDGGHSEGMQTLAFIGEGPHAEGRGTKAFQTAAHSEGLDTTASGANCHAQGQGTIAGATPFNCTISGTSIVIANIDATAFFRNGGPIILYNLSGGTGTTYFSGTLVSNPAMVGSDTHLTISAILTHTSGKIFASDLIVNAHSEGYNTIASNFASHAEGSVTTASSRSSHARGQNCIARHLASLTEGSGKFDNNGDAQISRIVAMNVTTDSAQTATLLIGKTDYLILPTSMSWAFDVVIMGRRSDGVSACFRRSGLITNISNTVSLVGSVQTVGTDNNSPSWSIAIVADNTHKSLNINVTGQPSIDIHWVAKVEVIEIIF